MAIARMAKVMIVSHRSQIRELLEALQAEGIVQILDAQRAMVSKEWPELQVELKKPKDIEDMVGRLEKAILFLRPYTSKENKRSIFEPLAAVNGKQYTEAVSGQKAMVLLEETESAAAKIEKIKNEQQAITELIEKLRPWEGLETPVEQIGQLNKAICFTSLIPRQQFERLNETLNDIAVVIEEVGRRGLYNACIIACMKEEMPEVQKALRSAEFEPVSFEGMSGTVREIIGLNRKKSEANEKQLAELTGRAGELSKERLALEILYDHYSNLLNREHTAKSVPATEQTIFLEGWVKQKDYPKLEKIAARFDAVDIFRLEAAEDEDIPVEIRNSAIVRPFETITRLYGMPHRFSIDPTVFLAPFFAVFFGLCLADAGYGLVLMIFLGWVLTKIRAGRGIIWMLLICSVMTFAAGVITGSWFGDALTSVVPAKYEGFYKAINGFKDRLTLFDPMKEPMKFFVLSLALGYLQIQFGLFIAFIFNIVNRRFAAAICEQLSWIVLLNSLVLLGLSKGGLLPAGIAKIFGLIAIAPAITILLFSERSGGWGARLGVGTFQLFGTVFYMGDTLSYVRIMALGMVGSGFGMAINVLVKLAMDVPYVGFILGAIVFVVGHSFNIAMSMLGAFVHSLRLQFVEFFPKFFTGGGTEFQPLRKKYRHIEIKE